MLRRYWWNMKNNIEIICLGWLEKGTGKHQFNVVYDKNGLSPCVLAGFSIKQQVTMIVVKSKNECKGK